MRRRLVFVSILFMLASLAPVTAQADLPVVLRLEGHEGPLECDPTAMQILCFQTVEGDPATAFMAGQEVRVELTAVPLDGAPAGAPHNLVVAQAGDQGDLEGIDSDPSNAIAASEVAESGQTVFLQFKVPESGTLYFWCDVGEHEFAGMNFEAEVQPATDEDTDDDPADNGTGDNGTGDDGNGTDGDAGSDAGNGTGGSDNGTAPDDGAGMGADGDTNTTDENLNVTGEEADADVTEESPAAPLWMLAALVLGHAALRRRRD